MRWRSPCCDVRLEPLPPVVAPGTPRATTRESERGPRPERTQPLPYLLPYLL